MNAELPSRPGIISESTWVSLTHKQSKIIAFIATRLGEELTIRQIKEGAVLNSLNSETLTNLNLIFLNKEAGVRINCREKQDPYRVLWTLEKEE